MPEAGRASIDGNTMTVNSDLVYNSDGNVGTPWEPFVIDISDALGISSVEDSGDGSSAWYSLHGIYLGTTKPTTPGVYFSRTAKDRLQGKKGKKVVVK